MRNKKMSRYMKIYLWVLGFFVAVLIAAVVVLWNLLSAFEQSRPKYVAEKVFEDYFRTMRVGQLAEIYCPELLKFETVESFNEKFAKSVDSDQLQYFSVSTDGNGNEQYVVSCQNKRVAYLTVSPTEKEAGFGFKYYELTDVEVFAVQDYVLNVKLPKGGALMVNGLTMGEEYISEKDIKDRSYDYMPKGVEGILYDKYTVDGLLFEPSFVAKDKDGKTLELVYDEVEECYVTPVAYDEQLEKEQSNYAIKVAEEYTKFLSNDAPFSSIGAYLDKNYDIYKRVRSIQVNWVREHYAYELYNQKASEFTKYTDNVFSCRVKLTETLSRKGYQDHTENIDITLYFHKVGSKYTVYEITNN